MADHGEDGADSANEAPVGAANVETKRKLRSRKAVAYNDDTFSDDDYMDPPTKRAKSAAKKTPVSKPKLPSKSTSASPAKSPTPKPKYATIPATQRAEAPLQVLESTPNQAAMIFTDTADQYPGVPLEQLRQMLPPQDYVRISILRSMAETQLVGSEKNLSRNLHPDLTPKPPTLTFELELRAMVATWVDLEQVTISCLALLEAEAVRYTSELVRDLLAVVQEYHETNGIVNGRPQKPLSNFWPSAKLTTDTTKESSSNASPTKSGENPSNAISLVSDDGEDSEEEFVPQDDQPAEENDGEPRDGEKRNSFAVPIVSLDLLAEVVVKRHVSLVRRLQYIVQRLAEDDQAQKSAKENVGTSANEDGEEEEDAKPAEVWIPTPELEAYLDSVDSSETLERQDEIRDKIMQERMVRVEKMPAATLDEWQTASSISLARPRRLPKFKQWLIDFCHWDPSLMFITGPLAVILSFMTYEHLRWIVRAAVQTVPTPNNPNRPSHHILPAERIRLEISKRIAAGDRVLTET
jgi:hypothetical protein